MSRARRPNTNVYRQIDPSVLRDLGQPTNANITGIQLDPVDALWVYVYFDQPVILSGAALEVPDWTINGLSFGGDQMFSTDQRVLHLKMAGTIAIGDAYDFQTTGANGGYQPLNGGVINTATGLVSEFPSVGQFNITSIAVNDSESITITFDAPVAITQPAQNTPELSGLLIASAVTLETFQGFDGTNTLQYTVTSAITSGLAWELTPPSTRNWTTLTAAAIAPASGTLDPP